LRGHNPFDLANEFLNEKDPNGPAQDEFRKYHEIETRAVMVGLIAFSRGR